MVSAQGGFLKSGHHLAGFVIIIGLLTTSCAFRNRNNESAAVLSIDHVAFLEVIPLRVSRNERHNLGLRSATSGSVAVPRTTSPLDVAAPRAWNNLLYPLCRVHSVNIFRRQLFAQAFFYVFLVLCSRTYAA